MESKDNNIRVTTSNRNSRKPKDCVHWALGAVHQQTERPIRQVLTNGAILMRGVKPQLSDLEAASNMVST